MSVILSDFNRSDLDCIRPIKDKMDKIQNLKELAVTDLRKAALEIAEAGLEAIDTEKVVKSGVVLNGEILRIREKRAKRSNFEISFCLGLDFF